VSDIVGFLVGVQSTAEILGESAAGDPKVRVRREEPFDARSVSRLVVSDAAPVLYLFDVAWIQAGC
jgi:hypothetical protein